MTTKHPRTNFTALSSLEDFEDVTFEDLEKVLDNTSKILFKHKGSNILPTLVSFKKEAKALKDKEKLSSHVTALNALAKRYGYKNFNTIKPYLQKEDGVLAFECSELKDKVLSFDSKGKENAFALLRRLIGKELLRKGRLFTKEETLNALDCYFSLSLADAEEEAETYKNANALHFVNEAKEAHSLVVEIYFTFNKYYSETDFTLFFNLLSFECFFTSFYYIKQRKSSKKDLANRIADFLMRDKPEWKYKPNIVSKKDSEDFIEKFDFARPFNEVMKDVAKERFSGSRAVLEKILGEESINYSRQRFAYIVQQSPLLRLW